MRPALASVCVSVGLGKAEGGAPARIDRGAGDVCRVLGGKGENDLTLGGLLEPVVTLAPNEE